MKYSLSGSYRALARDGSRILDGLQGSVAYGVTDKIVSAGVKWTIDLRDLRWMPSSEVARIAGLGQSAFATCKAERSSITSAEDLENACFPKLVQAQRSAVEQSYGQLVSWRPSFALALASGYDFEAGRRDKSNASLLAELSGAVGRTTAAITANSGLEQLPPDAMAPAYRVKLSGGLQVSDKFSPIAGWPLTLAAGAKLLACVSDQCADDESSVELGVGADVQLSKGVQVGFHMKWSGTAERLDDAIGGIAFSYTFAK